MVDLKIRLLGGLEVSGPSGKTLAIPTRKAKALLAVLARQPGERQTRERLAGMLWPESSESQARSSLRQSLKLLRRAFSDVGPEVVVGTADMLALEPANIWVDVRLFEQLSEAGTADALEEAAELYRGDFLATLLPPSRNGPMEHWGRSCATTVSRVRGREPYRLQSSFLGRTRCAKISIVS
jgi:DNA-binding SARP family transcriptional activator